MILVTWPRPFLQAQNSLRNRLAHLSGLQGEVYLAQLNHRNFLASYEIEATDSKNFIAMEFIEGKTLRRQLASGVNFVASPRELTHQHP